MVEPTDRSMPPVRMTKVMPTATMPMYEGLFENRFRRQMVKKRGSKQAEDEEDDDKQDRWACFAGRVAG